MTSGCGWMLEELGPKMRGDGVERIIVFDSYVPIMIFWRFDPSLTIRALVAAATVTVPPVRYAIVAVPLPEGLRTNRSEVVPIRRCQFTVNADACTPKSTTFLSLWATVRLLVPAAGVKVSSPAFSGVPIETAPSTAAAPDPPEPAEPPRRERTPPSLLALAPDWLWPCCAWIVTGLPTLVPVPLSCSGMKK